MSLKYKIEHLSVHGYLEGELLSPFKHEFIACQAYTMAGASSNHNRILSSLGRELGNHLRHTQCEPFTRI